MRVETIFGGLPCRRFLTPCVSPSRAPVLPFAHYFQAPATQARSLKNGCFIKGGRLIQGRFVQVRLFHLLLFYISHIRIFYIKNIEAEFGEGSRICKAIPMAENLLKKKLACWWTVKNIKWNSMALKRVFFCMWNLWWIVSLSFKQHFNKTRENYYLGI